MGIISMGAAKVIDLEVTAAAIACLQTHLGMKENSCFMPLALWFCSTIWGLWPDYASACVYDRRHAVCMTEAPSYVRGDQQKFQEKLFDKQANPL